MEQISPKRRVKNLTLSETTVAYVTEYAQLHGLKFSRAIEILALMSLRNAQALGLSTLLGQAVRREATHHYNRLAKLIAYAGLEAGMAKEAAHQLLFIKLLETAREVPQVELLDGRLSINQDSPAGQQVVSSYKRRQELFRTRAVRTMKKPIPELAEILEEYEKSQVKPAVVALESGDLEEGEDEQS